MPAPSLATLWPLVMLPRRGSNCMTVHMHLQHDHPLHDCCPVVSTHTIKGQTLQVCTTAICLLPWRRQLKSSGAPLLDDLTAAQE